MNARMMPTIPDDFPVKVLGPNDKAEDRATCGECGRSWDDAVITSWTPAPSARCPFEYFHGPARTTEKLEAFRMLVQQHQRERYAKQYPNVAPPDVLVRPGKRWVKVDVGGSGKYMVDEDGSILGIKGYGVPHPGHQYGTLDTISEWNWGDYVAYKVKR